MKSPKVRKAFFRNLIAATKAKFIRKQVEIKTDSALVSKEAEEDQLLPSRHKYATQVATIIRKYHGKYKDSFILGLSGKWGSGKTSFLDILKPKLTSSNTERNFVVLAVTPWKYGGDVTTFLRNFLKILNETADDEHADEENVKKMSWRERFQYKQTYKNLLNNLNRDISKPTIELNFLSIASFLVLFFWLLYKLLVSINVIPWGFIAWLNFDPQNKVFFLSLYDVIAILAIPILLYQVRVTITNKRVSTLDGFSNIYDQILKRFPANNLVIFIDDLDRVSPEVARTVLDSLRTFVDNGNVTYIVTGDHTVLERHIGGQLIENSNEEAEQTEEGRRYLKKMFNVYWPLPIVTSQEFSKFLASEFKKRQHEIDIIFSPSENKEEDIDLLKIWLSRYFDKNFRNVIRFLETVIFNFGLVEAQLENVAAEDEDLLRQLTDVKNYPLLFIRILMIQELAAPLYEKYTETPSLVRRIEEDLIKKENEVLNDVIGSLKEDHALSPHQEKFLREFMYEQPRFYKEGEGILPYATDPFIFLASSSEFVDIRGLVADEFIQAVTNQNVDIVTSALQSAGKEKLTEYKERLNGYLSTHMESNLDEFMQIIRVVTESFSNISPTSLLQTDFVVFFSKLDLSTSTSHAQPVERRRDVALFFSRWLDILPKDTNLDPFYTKLDLQHRDAINQIEPFINSMDKFGVFSSTLVCRWLVYYYGLNQDRSLELLESLDGRITPESREAFLVHTESLAIEFAKQPESERSQRFLTLINKLNNANLNQTLGDKLAEQIMLKRTESISWIASNYSSLVNIIGVEKIPTAVVSLLRPCLNNIPELLSTVSLASPIITLFRDQLWDEIFKLEDGDLLAVVQQIINNSSMLSLAPSSEYSLLLANKLIAISNTKKADAESIEIIHLLKKSQLWSTWKVIPLSLNKKLEKLEKRDEAMGDAIREVRKTWTAP